MKDGEKVYEAIHRYVNKVIKSQFSEDTVKEDKLLQAFFEGISKAEYGDIKGFPKKPESRE